VRGAGPNWNSDLLLPRRQGLWVVRAPGEAEATCAALDRAGRVHGCASADSDCLLFGAETLFPTLKLLARALPQSATCHALCLLACRFPLLMLCCSARGLHGCKYCLMTLSSDCFCGGLYFLGIAHILMQSPDVPKEAPAMARARRAGRRATAG
jgi:hypothetical protein